MKVQADYPGQGRFGRLCLCLYGQIQAYPSQFGLC